jgi:hypothetical protein
MKPSNHKLTSSLATGFHRGLNGFFWVLKILVPISLLTAVLAWSGWLNRLDFILIPIMKLIGLPPVAVLPLIAGLLTGPYGAIAAMAPLPLTIEQMTLLAVFLLISHNLIQEGVIQANSGLSFLPATLIRLLASVVTVMMLSFVVGIETADHAKDIATAGYRESFLTMLKPWTVETLVLSLKIMIIIIPIMVGLEMLKNYRLIDRAVELLAPLLRIMGLRKETGFLWLTAVVFGLTYGAAVIVEEVRQGNLGRDDLERLQISIGINHSMIEDPALFIAIGLGFWWMVLPRLMASVCAVHLFVLFRRLSVHRLFSSIGALRKK